MARPGPLPGSEGAQAISRAHCGSHEHDHGGGFAADHERAVEAGRRGGKTVKAKHGTGFYREIGARAGKTCLERHGREHFVRIGALGGLAKAAKLGKEEDS